MSNIEMQVNCVFCGHEQYSPAIWDISHGRHPCCWCGKFSKPMTTAEYRNLIEKNKKMKSKEQI